MAFRICSVCERVKDKKGQKGKRINERVEERERKGKGLVKGQEAEMTAGKSWH